MHYDVIIVGAGSMGRLLAIFWRKAEKKRYCWMPLIRPMTREAIMAIQESSDTPMVRGKNMFHLHLKHSNYGMS